MACREVVRGFGGGGGGGGGGELHVVGVVDDFGFYMDPVGGRRENGRDGHGGGRRVLLR